MSNAVTEKITLYAVFEVGHVMTLVTRDRSTAIMLHVRLATICRCQAYVW